MIPIALVDDHTLLRNALASLINSLPGYRVVLQANNGKHFIELLNPENLPSIVLLDITMPEMNGFETAGWLSANYPQIKIIALSMQHAENAVIGMLQHGAKGYLAKDSEMPELEKAMLIVLNKGMYINQLLYDNVIHVINKPVPENCLNDERGVYLSAREKEFLQWVCTDKAYKEIATAMYISPRTVDGYRDSLFKKLEVSSRIGLVIFAIRNNLARV